MHRNYRRKFNAAQYNYLDHRYFRLKWYRTDANRQLRRQAKAAIRHDRVESLPLRQKPRDFNGHFF